MTKLEFISFLESSLDLPDSKDAKTVLDFFQEKFSFCASPEEEVAMIDAFGAPEQFIEKLKIEIESLSKKGKKKNFLLKNYLESILRDSLSPDNSNTENNDLIFSKPIQTEKASEVVHSLDDHEVKTLFGEKVVIEDRAEPVEEIDLEPIDKANGLTTEEIRLAKAKTLEKAKSFSDHENKSSADQAEGDDSPIPLEEDDAAHSAKVSNPPKCAKTDFPGLLNRVLPKENCTKTKRALLLALLTVAISPILIAILGLALFVYLGLFSLTVAVSILLFAIMFASIGIGVAELVHGFLLIFSNLTAALIELGYGTVLVSIIIAVCALIYEFIFGIVPKWIRWLTAILVHYAKLLYCYLYGGKA